MGDDPDDDTIISELDALYEKAATHNHLGNLEAQEEAWHHLCGESRRKLGALHPATIGFASRRASFYASRDQLAKATEVWRDVLSSQTRIGGATSRRALGTAYQLANAYFENQKYVDAEHMYRRVAQGHETLGIVKEATFFALGSLGYALAHQNRYEEAEQACVKAVEGARKAFGHDNPLACRLASGLAQVHFRHFYFLAGSKSSRDQHTRLRCVTGLARLVQGMAHLLPVDTAVDPGAQPVSQSGQGRNLGDFSFLSTIAQALGRCARQIFKGAILVLVVLVILIWRLAKVALGSRLTPPASPDQPAETEPATVPTSSTAVVEMLGMLGRMCSSVEDDTSARFLLGHHRRLLQLLSDSGSRAALFPHCDLCDFPICALPQYICTTCPGTNLCSDCHDTHQEGAHGEDLKLHSCQLHTFLRISQGDATLSGQASSQNPSSDLASFLANLIEVRQNKDLAFCTELMPEPISFWADGEIEKPSSQTFLDRTDLAILPEELKRQAEDVFRIRIYQLKWPIPAMLEVFNYPACLPPWTITSTSSSDEIFKAVVKRSAAIIDAAVGDELPLLGSSCPCDTTARHESTGTPSWDSIYATKCLDPHQPAIRLLEVLPGTGFAIQGRLYCVTFSESLSYEALSYVWGSQSAGTLKSIDVDGQSLPITSNLFDALVSLRDPVQPRTLWVDAICINQANNEEKAAQVAMMSRVYRSASQVVIFLGDSQPGDDALFGYFNRPRGENLQVKPIAHSENAEDAPVRQFVAFCTREWWSRIWTQQEYCLALGDPVFQVGRYSTTAANIIADMMALAEEALKNGSLGTSIDAVGQAMQLFSRRHLYLGAQGGHLMPSLLFSRDRARATDARDVIYGRREFFEPLVQTLFPADYSLSACKLFERMAIWILGFDNCIEIYWKFPYKLPQSCSAPSWVPDFSRRRAPLSGPGDITLLELDRKSTTLPVIYNRILTMHARTIDVVDEVFDLDEPTWLQQASGFWHLDNYFASLRGRGSPSLTRLGTHLARISDDVRIPRWSSYAGQESEDGQKLNHSISAHLGSFTIADYQSLTENVFGSVIKELENTILVALDCDPPQKSAAVRTLIEVFDRLVTLQWILNKGPRECCADLLGASIFDFHNLEAQVKDLRQPSRSARCTGKVRKLVRSRLQRLLEHETAQRLPKACVPSLRPSSMDTLPRPQYDNLQAAIVDCRFEEEVLLRSRLLLRVAREINQRVLAPNQTSQAPLASAPDGSGAAAGSGTRDQGSSDAFNDYTKSIAESLKRRTVFVTRDSLVGMGAAGVTDIRVGDEVVMTELVTMPLILRPTEDPGFHQHVGFACVKGLVDGRFHKLKEHEKPERKVFKIR